MPADIREYLTSRFQSDAVTLRARAAALTASRKPMPGPDAALSLAMASACEEVAGLAELLPRVASLTEILSALQALLPQLHARANSPEVQATPAVRSVFVGAATRVQEVIAAELLATQQSNEIDFDDDDIDDVDDNDVNGNDTPTRT